MNYENKAKPGGRRIVSIMIISVMVLTALFPAITEDSSAAGFSGKKGSKYTVTSGGTITYGSGEGG